MSLIYEYGKWIEAPNSGSLKQLLRNIWAERLTDQVEDQDVEGEDIRFQPFLQFDASQIRANNYVGFIQHDNELIEIYPKVFRHLESPGKNLMLQHIFFWFSYCRKWRFPFNQANLDTRGIDKFPELIIYLIANQFLETVSNHPFMQYQPIEETLLTPRGSINFNRYINKGLIAGNHHQIECDYEPFTYDNSVNRIIKYCARLLSNLTGYAENQRLLQEVIFILDEVEDVPVSLREVNSVSVNAFYSDYGILMEMCKTILNQQLYSHNSYDSSQWCLLFPMEYIFEDFVAGFLETHFSDKWKVEYQKSNAYLASRPQAFQMQHDIFLSARDGSSREIIIDTKYKLRKYEESDNKRGVVQADLYQVVSYAYRRGCKEVILIYPNTNEMLCVSSAFEIESGFPGNEMITVKVVEIPFWSMNDFEGLSDRLKKELQTIL